MPFRLQISCLLLSILSNNLSQTTSYTITISRKFEIAINLIGVIKWHTYVHLNVRNFISRTLDIFDVQKPVLLINILDRFIDEPKPIRLEFQLPTFVE